MNILQINKFHYLRGGSERHVFELSDLLEKKGHRVFHFSMKDEKNISSSDTRYFVSPVDLHKFSIKNIFKYFYNYEAVKNLKKLLKERQIDISHVHNIDGQISPAILRVLKKNNIPVVQTLHDYKLICPNAKLFCKSDICRACKGGEYYNSFLKKCVHDSYAKSFLAALESYLYKTILKSDKYIDVYIAPSKFMKDICVKFGILEKKVLVIHNFLNTKQEDLEGDIEEGNYLLYFGRLVEEKGVSVLIEAMEKIHSDLKLKIVGAGPDLKTLKKKVTSLNMSDRIDFVGYKKSQELSELINRAKAVVVPSIWYENMPYSLLESLRAGKVSFVARTGGMQELIEDRVNGFLFKRGDSKDLAEKIDSLEKVDILEMKKNAKEGARNFGSELFYEKLMSVYKAL